MCYGRKAFGPHRKRSAKALARDIASSILAARRHGEQRPISMYTHLAETQRLVETILEAEAAQVGVQYPVTVTTDLF